MTLARLLSEATAAESLPATGDVLTIGSALLDQLNELHEQGLVGSFVGPDSIDYDGQAVTLRQPEGRQPAINRRVIRRLNPLDTASGVAVAARLAVDHGDGSTGPVFTRRDVLDPSGPGPAGRYPAEGSDEPTRPDGPMLVVGYRAWEQLNGHHDPVTDVHLAGLFLVSYATGLDLDDPDSLEHLASNRNRLLALNPSLHPVVADVLSRMIDPDRHRRPPDINSVIARFDHHRDLPADLDLSPAYEPNTDWRRAVLGILRERVFDTTRRNRALYFRHTASAVSLTEASIPLLLSVDRIRPDDVLTWTGQAAKEIGSGKKVDLEKWCRFEESPHVVAALDNLMSAERKFRVESGAGRLRLIVAFLHWTDPETNEAISSPLLTLPVELSRQKGVKKRYQMAAGTEMEVNPILRFVFRRRYDIDLPASIDGDHDSIVSLVDHLRQSVQRTDPGLTVELIDKPRINLIRRRAQLRLDTYRRRRASALAASGRWRRQQFSYDLEDWRPLGLGLYDRFVRPREFPFRELAGAPPKPRSRPQAMAGSGAGVADPAERTTVTYSMAGADTSRQRWEVDLCAVTLAMLGTRRISLARDYDELIERTAVEAGPTGQPFELLFGPEARRVSRSGGRGDEAEAEAGPAGRGGLSLDQRLVLPADEAQAMAVARALTGESFIIQGPPGTGKSQTIANVIAAMASQGKRILFVCEKRAALDVVSHRLNQVGLGELVATIHDSQLDRKEFVHGLGRTYESWLGTELADPAGETGHEPGREPVDDGRASALAAAQATLRPLEATVAEFAVSRAGEPSTGRLVTRAIELRADAPADRTDDKADVEPVIDEVDLASWIQARPHLDEVTDALRDAGLPTGLDQHAIFVLRPHTLSGGDAINQARDIGTEIETPVSVLLQSAGFDGAAIGDATLAEVTSLAEGRELLEAAAQAGALAAFNLTATRASGPELVGAAARYREAEATVEKNREVLSRWVEPLNPSDARAGLTLATEAEGSLFRFLNGRWRSLKKLVRASYRFDQHQVEPTIAAVLQELVDYHTVIEKLAELRAEASDAFGWPDPVAALDVAEHNRNNPILQALIANSQQASTILSAVVDVEQRRRLLLTTPDTTLTHLAELADGLRRSPIGLERAAINWARLADQPAPTLLAARSNPSLDDVEFELIRRSLARRALDSLPIRTGAEIDDIVDRAAADYRRLLDANARSVVLAARRRFLDNVAHSEASMAGRSDDDKNRKRTYNAGRRLLEKEFAKKMRYRSIRELATGEPGAVVRDLRPIWLMSPLSVSDTLPLESDLFDIVIFDEASQIPVEDAIPTVCRAPQVIVVGDRMQLPPTRFFASEEADDIAEVLDPDGTKLSISLDADSFLTQSDHGLPSTMLSWHYRSRSESLIAYSNNAFYGGDLATVPDRVLPSGRRTPLTADDAGDAVINKPAVLQRPISFHHIANGVYQDRHNQPEADYIAELVRALLLDDTVDLTIGIVAFSEAQQRAIEAALDELALLDNGFAAALAAETERVDEDEYVGLFVKNLENVQGDERDLIIMSVCYGPGQNTPMKMNFGPINQAGGERRLNVIFSRAKRHIAVVSTITGAAITNTHNQGADHLARFLDYAAAESIGDTETSTLILAQQRGRAEEDQAAISSAVADEIAGRLRANGHHVDLAVGRSDFHIDLAVRGSDQYRLGIIIEPGNQNPTSAAAHTTAQYVAEAAVLTAFGWPIMRVLLSEWWTQPATVLSRIEGQLASQSSGPAPGTGS